MKNRIFTYMSLGTLLLLLLNWTVFTCTATIVWSDNFDDKNYDGWTVQEGEFSAANNVLEISGTGYSLIYRTSSVVTGTWSFGMHVGESTWPNLVGFMASDIYLGTTQFWLFENGYCLTFGRDPTRFTFMKYEDGMGLDWAGNAWVPLTGATGWQHIDITRNSDGEIHIYINGTLRIEVTDTDITTSEYFCFHGRGAGVNYIALDNVSVSDSIDITPTTTTTTETMTETTTEETTTETTTTDTTSPPIPMEWLAVAIGVPVILVIVLVVWKKR